MSVKNKILPIVHTIMKLTKTHPFFTLFAKNTVAVLLLVVKMAAPLSNIKKLANKLKVKREKSKVLKSLIS